MSIVEKTLRKLDAARQNSGQTARQPVEHADLLEQEAPTFFSLRVVVLLGMAVGLSLVVAVMLLIGKVQNGIYPASSVPASGNELGTVKQIQPEQPVLRANAATDRNVPQAQATVNSIKAEAKIDTKQAVESDVRAALAKWAEAWSRRDVDAYLAFYADDFAVPSGMSRAAWEAQRKSRIGKPRSIQVTLGQIEVALSADDVATVRLVQDYRADNYRESGARKALRLKKVDGRWRITSEKAA